MEEKVIEKIRETEIEILDVIHQVCMENGLRFSLAYGTLIGAVRHGGFIPWDDDIDIIMPREDYEKLISVWDSSAPKGYILQNAETDGDFTQNFTKIRKDKTAFIQSEDECKKKYHKGVFVDIFPCDRVAPGKFLKTVQYVSAAVNMLYTREYTSGSKGIIGAVEKILLGLPAGFCKPIKKLSGKIIKRWNSDGNLMYFVPVTIKDAGIYYPADMFDEIKSISFCKKEYCCVSDYDMVLRAEYGDYTELPPEEERVWMHHPIIVDFEHNYEELNIRK